MTDLPVCVDCQHPIKPGTAHPFFTDSHAFCAELELALDRAS